jgi:hypothetical protein
LSSRRRADLGGLLLLLSLGYLLLPGHPLTFLTGVPLGPSSLLLAGVLGACTFAFGLPRDGRVMRLLVAVALVLIAVRVVLWWSAPSYGLAASYFSRARLGGAIERSTDFPGVSYTRRDAQVGTFATHFLNDVERYNFYEEGEPDRLALPFSVRWDGYLHVPSEGNYQVRLSATGSAMLSLDGRPALTVSAGPVETVDQAAMRLAAGLVPIRVDYINPGGRSPSLGLEWDLGGDMAPISVPYLTTEPIEPSRLAWDAGFAILARSVDGAFVLVVLLSCPLSLATWLGRRGAAEPTRWERPVLGLFLLATLLYALTSSQYLYGRTVILEGGQDWLTYESHARDILLNGPLMTLGEPLGRGKPYFFQPFYPYYLAGLHWLSGEGLWGPTVLQVFGLGVAGVLAFYLAARLLGRPAAWWSLGLFAILTYTQLDWVARKLLSENLYFAVLPAAILSLLRFADERQPRDIVLSGLLFGVASITRAPTLLYVPCAALLLVAMLRREGASRATSAGAAVFLVALTIAIAALVPLRNYVVSGRPALVATNGGATLLLAHAPPPTVRLSGVDKDPLYNALKLDRPTREVVEFARQNPVGYAATLVPLGLYALGFSGAIEGTTELTPEVLAVTALYLVALVSLAAARTLRAALLHAFIAIHFAIMMTFLPYVYGYRQVLPMTLLMLVVGGGLLAAAGRRVLGMLHGRAVTSPPLAEQRSG